MLMNCNEFADMLDSYASLSEDEMRAVEEHTLHCDKCKEELEFMRSMIDTTSSLPPIEPPEDFLDKLNARLDKEIEQESKLTRFVRRSRPYIGRYGAVAACFAVAVAVGVNADMLVSRMNNSDDGVISRTTTSVEGTETSDMPEDIKTEKSSDKTDDVQAETAVTSIIPTFGDMAEAQSRTADISSGTVGAGTSQTFTAQPNNADNGKSSVSAQSAKTPASTVKQGTAAGTASAAGSSTETAATPVPVPQLSTVTPSASYNSGSASAEVREEAQLQDNNSSLVSGSSASVSYSAANEITDNKEADVSTSYIRARIAEEPDEYAVVYASEEPDEYADAQISDGLDINGPASDYTIVQGSVQNETAYAVPLSSTLAIKSKDADRAKEVIDVFVAGVYGNYYMITSGDMNNLLSQLGREGIWYDANINESGDKISFKLLIY
jgi:hypothetical protein